MSESLTQQSSVILKEFIRNPATRSGFNSPLGKPNKPTIVSPANASTITNNNFILSTYEHPLSVSQKSINGIVFDADEESQNRMARAILALQINEVPTTEWILSNNATVTVTVAELGEALRLAGQEQTKIWTTYR